MKITKKQLPAFLTVFAAIIMLPFNAFASFSDVTADNPQYEAINTLYEEGVVKGYGDGTFRPDSLVNKAEFFKMAFNHAGYYPREGFYQTPFTDFPSGAWFSPYVLKALELDLIDVNPDWPVFLGAAPVERIEALKIVMPLKGIPTPFTEEKNTVFTDISPDYKYFNIVKGAETSGVYIQEENPVFLPLSPLTRGDAAELLYKANLYRESVRGTTTQEIEINLGDYLEYESKEMDVIGNDKFPIFVSVWNKINEQYLYKDTLDRDELMYGAIGGMVDSLNDPYSVFEEPELADDMWDTLEGSYEGIGTIIDTYNDTFIIIGVIKNSPADLAGVKIGDAIVSIDGKTFGPGQINELINAIKGPAGTKVKIVFDRDGKEIPMEITREEITLDTVLLEATATDIPASIGYVAIYQFTDSTAGEFDKMVSDIMATDPKGIILDLRDNPGGYVDSSIEILGYFIEKGETVARLKIGTKLYEETVSGSAVLKDLPVVVLINENTASAAEIVAAALSEINGSLLIGEKTYGKGTVQEVSIYTDGSLLKLSIAKWLTPMNHDIDATGIAPDIQVIPTKDDTLGKTDSQLSKAISELEKMM